jgi:hypothetical protein
MTPLLTCKEVLAELSDFLDEKTDIEIRAKLEKHIAECPNCWVICERRPPRKQYRQPSGCARANSAQAAMRSSFTDPLTS